MTERTDARGYDSVESALIDAKIDYRRRDSVVVKEGAGYRVVYSPNDIVVTGKVMARVRFKAKVKRYG